MERHRWALLAIDEAAPSGLSPVQLQKTLFLIGKNLTREVGDSYYSFVPYNYGPFDPNVYSDAELLIRQGLVFETRSAGRSWSYYRITRSGHTMAEQSRQTCEVSERGARYVREVVKWVQSLTFAQLLSAIYRAYPEYKANSVFVA